MKPYADDSAASSVGDMKIENGRDRIAFYGSLDLTRDKAGLALARDLQTALDGIIKALESDPALPAAIPPPRPARTVPNPFG